MSRLLLSLFLLPVLTAASADLIADKLSRNGAVLHGIGHVRSRSGNLDFQADEGTLNTGTGEIDLRGHVHVTLPGRDDHSLFRYGDSSATGQPGAIVTDKPAELYANRISLKDNQLTASGNVVLDAEYARIQADEMSMSLRNADARLTGHVRATGLGTWSRDKRSRPETGPEIVK
jgi:lipopolysaccharide assembly outer membrane protein LptD (OstA)